MNADRMPLRITPFTCGDVVIKVFSKQAADQAGAYTNTAAKQMGEIFGKSVPVSLPKYLWLSNPIITGDRSGYYCGRMVKFISSHWL